MTKITAEKTLMIVALICGAIIIPFITDGDITCSILAICLAIVVGKYYGEECEDE